MGVLDLNPHRFNIVVTCALKVQKIASPFFVFFIFCFFGFFHMNGCDDKFVLAVPLAQCFLDVKQHLQVRVFFSLFFPHSRFSVLFQFLFFIKSSFKTTDKTRTRPPYYSESVAVQDVSCNRHLKFGHLKCWEFVIKI